MTIQITTHTAPSLCLSHSAWEFKLTHVRNDVLYEEVRCNSVTAKETAPVATNAISCIVARLCTRAWLSEEHVGALPLGDAEGKAGCRPGNSDMPPSMVNIFLFT